MKKVTFLTLIFFSQFSFSQVFTNSSGNGIFYTEKAKQFKAETKVSKKTTEVNFQLNSLLNFKDPIKYYKRKGKDTIYTVKTSFGWLLKLGMTSSDNFTQKIKNPGFNIELGILKGLDSINRNELRTWGYSWGLSTKLQYDNKKVLYDISNQSISYEYPYTFSVNSHFEFYLANIDAIGIGLTFGYVNSTNYSSLKSFQNIPIEFIDNNIASIGDEVGKIGSLKRTNNLYISFAFPVFPFEKPNSKSKELSRNILERIALTPYLHYLFLDSNTLNPGISVSLVNHALNNSSFEPLFDSGFSIGIDWIRNDGDWSTPIFFLGGTLSIDGIIESIKKEDI
ncbi:hypothetical protein [Maribacter litoralis]|uniref:hypothetical protein n=1 Tax=Maribacter litoralis TaxID=2059726 RepID=UPI000E30D782|nr:hypothetical protein [Maribacter litoralis]